MVWAQPDAAIVEFLPVLPEETGFYARLCYAGVVGSLESHAYYALGVNMTSYEQPQFVVPIDGLQEALEAVLQQPPASAGGGGE